MTAVPTRGKRAGLVLALLSALGGCGFENAEEPSLTETNSCSDDESCGANSECIAGMCMARSTDAPLTVAFEISPLRMPDGSEGQPFIKGGEEIDGPRSINIALPLPVEIGGRVRNEGQPVPADITFTPQWKVPNVTATPTTVTIAGGRGDREEPDFVVRLLEGVEYRMVVRPHGGALPPVSRQLVAEGDEIDVDYDDFELLERTFSIAFANDDQSLSVRAVSRDNGEVISSMAPLGDGPVELSFISDAPYRLVISPESAAMQAAAAPTEDTTLPEAEECDSQTPRVPVFTIDDLALTEDPDSGMLSATLPEVPARIRYQGSIDLCEGATAATEDAQLLPISLRSQALSLHESDTAVAASVSATAQAHHDPEQGQFRFCVDLIAGDYEVVVTPPASMACGVLAERRLIEAPDDMAARGALLELPAALRFEGMLRTTDLQPLRNATISALALGREDAIEGEEDNRILSQFNRSREAVTNEAGEFTLLLDRGSYDIVAKPPPESGFPWQVHRDVHLNNRWKTMFDMRAPIRLAGTLSYDGQSSSPDEVAVSLEGTVVRAFAVVDDPFDTDRAIAIGKATADADGNFVLLLPPMLNQSL